MVEFACVLDFSFTGFSVHKERFFILVYVDTFAYDCTPKTPVAKTEEILMEFSVHIDDQICARVPI